MILRRPLRAIRRGADIVLVGLALALAVPHVVSAQGALTPALTPAPATASLSGTVADETGSMVPGVTVAIRNVDSGLRREVITNQDGAYAFPLLQPARYILSATLHGFAPIEIPDVIVNPNDRLTLAVTLLVAALTDAVIVTAQKRGEERLLDVPIPVTVLKAEQLAANSQVLLRDYYGTVPGLSLAPNYIGRQQLSLRGIMTGGNSNPTVGITIDDVPHGASTETTGGAYVPDIDPGDLARIEVLRGPQGTLYGANSMGGLIRYVTVDPAVERYSGRVEVGTNSVHNGSEPGYSLRASVNIPLSDTWAMRASGFTRQDPGYIDDPVLHLTGVNKAVATGGMLSALWRPSPDFSLRLGGMYQRINADGASEVLVQPGFGDLQQTFLARSRGYERAVQAYSARLKARFDGVELTSITGFNDNDQSASDDRSSAFASAIQNLYGVKGLRYLNLSQTKKVTQELRLSAPLGRRLEWQAGAFYSHENSPGVLTMDAEDTATGQTVGRFLELANWRWFDEYAAFAGVTVHATSRLDVQIAGRESRDRLVVPRGSYTGPFTMAVLGQPSPVIDPPTESATEAFTYLVTPQFKIAPDVMVYGRFASGYRPGGPNVTVAIANGAPAKYEPDKTHNYELGLKADLLRHRLSVDASLYRIDWTDIQIGLRIPTATWSDNGGTARSQGVELSMAATPITGLTVSAWATYNDAVLTRAFPATSTAYGAAGDRLPFATRFSLHIAPEQQFGLWRHATGFVGGAVSYVGDRVGTFQATASRQGLPAYTKTDLRAGMRYDTWTASVFVNNVADTRGLINGGLGYVPTNAFVYIPPRTVGLSLSRSF